MKKQSFSRTSFLIIITLLLIFMMIQVSEAQQKNWPKGVSIAGSTLGSAMYIFAGAWGKILTDKFGISTQVEVAGGSAQHVQLVHSKQTDLAPVTMGPAYEGFVGTGWAKEKYNGIRNMFPMYPSYFQWWTLAKTNIKSIHDLNGQVMALSGAGSPPDIYCRRMFELFNIKPKRIVNGSFGDTNNMLKDGMLDASAAIAGIPHPAPVEMLSTHEIRILGLSRVDAEKFVSKNPGLSIDIIPVGTYKGQDKPIETISLWTAMITHKDKPEDFIYAVIKATFENKDALMATFKGAKDIIPENIPKTYKAIPLHVGAVKYYKEKGIPIPDSELPPEYKK